MRYLILIAWLTLVGIAIGWLGLAAAEQDASGPEPANPPELSIPFANQGGVRDWIAQDESTVLIQDNFRKWYKVRLAVPSRALLHAEGIVFVTGPSGSLDSTGAIAVRGHKLPILSITAGEAPKRQRR